MTDEQKQLLVDALKLVPDIQKMAATQVELLQQTLRCLDNAENQESKRI